MEDKKKDLMKYLEENESSIKAEDLEEYVEKTLQWEEDNAEWISAMREELVRHPRKVIPFLMGTINGILRVNGASITLIEIWNSAVRAVLNWLVRPRIQ